MIFICCEASSPYSPLYYLQNSCDFLLLQLLFQLTALHGQEAERHLFRCLFSSIDFSGDGKSSSGKDAYQIQLLQQECTSLIAKPNCASILCFAVENPLQHQKVRFTCGFMDSDLTTCYLYIKLVLCRPTQDSRSEELEYRFWLSFGSSVET